MSSLKRKTQESHQDQQKKKIRLLFNDLILNDTEIRKTFYDVLFNYKKLLNIDFLVDGWKHDTSLIAKDILTQHTNIASFGVLSVSVRFAILLHALKLEPEQFNQNIKYWQQELSEFEKFIYADMETLRYEDMLREYEGYSQYNERFKKCLDETNLLLQELRYFGSTLKTIPANRNSTVVDTSKLYDIFVKDIYDRISLSLLYKVSPYCSGVYIYRIPVYYNALDFEYGTFYTLARNEQDARIRATLHVLQLSVTPFLENITASDFKNMY